jgi:hypothetical protein
MDAGGYLLEGGGGGGVGTGGGVEPGRARRGTGVGFGLGLGFGTAAKAVIAPSRTQIRNRKAARLVNRPLTLGVSMRGWGWSRKGLGAKL